MRRKKLESVLSQFDMAGIDYDVSDYISHSMLARENGTHSINLVFGYKNRNAIRSRELILENEDIAIEIYKLLSYGRKKDEVDKNNFLESLLSNTESSADATQNQHSTPPEAWEGITTDGPTGKDSEIYKRIAREGK